MNCKHLSLRIGKQSSIEEQVSASWQHSIQKKRRIDLRTWMKDDASHTSHIYKDIVPKLWKISYRILAYCSRKTQIMDFSNNFTKLDLLHNRLHQHHTHHENCTIPPGYDTWKPTSIRFETYLHKIHFNTIPRTPIRSPFLTFLNHNFVYIYCFLSCYTV
jgi:hypothetical protein